MADRWCTKGQHYVAEGEFYVARSGKLNSWCKGCRREASREYREQKLSTPESAAAFRKRNRKNGNRWAKKNLEKKRRSSRDQKARRRAAGFSDAEYTRAWRAANPDKAKAHARCYKQKVMDDPVRHAAYLETRRLQYRMQKMREGKDVRTARARVPAKEFQMRIPREPLTKFLLGVKSEQNVNLGEMSAATGIHRDQLRGILNRKYDRVAISTVDKCLTVFDGPPLRSLYPEL